MAHAFALVKIVHENHLVRLLFGRISNTYWGCKNPDEISKKVLSLGQKMRDNGLCDTIFTPKTDPRVRECLRAK